ncbi:hypothetical protein BH23CHL3_BH23CHL3_01020 [soil metagenome]
MIVATARSQHTTPQAFIWNDHSRFVEVHPVRLGWLVVWGHHEDLGSIRIQEGNAQYRSLDGARRRLVDSALEVTRSHRAAADAARMFDFFSFPEHEVGSLPESL